MNSCELGIVLRYFWTFAAELNYYSDSNSITSSGHSRNIDCNQIIIYHRELHVITILMVYFNKNLQVLYSCLRRVLPPVRNVQDCWHWVYPWHSSPLCRFSWSWAVANSSLGRCRSHGHGKVILVMNSPRLEFAQSCWAQTGKWVEKHSETLEVWPWRPTIPRALMVPILKPLKYCSLNWVWFGWNTGSLWVLKKKIWSEFCFSVRFIVFIASWFIAFSWHGSGWKRLLASPSLTLEVRLPKPEQTNNCRDALHHGAPMSAYQARAIYGAATSWGPSEDIWTI